MTATGTAPWDGTPRGYHLLRSSVNLVSRAYAPTAAWYFSTTLAGTRPRSLMS